MVVWRTVGINFSNVLEMGRNADGVIEVSGGADGVLLRLLSRYVPFEYKLIEQEDRQWGGVGPDGMWTGMIGTLQKGEADLAVSWIANTYTRNQVVDFSFPYLVDATIFYTPSPHLSSKVFAFADPFDDTVWIVLFFCLILSALLVALLTNYSVGVTRRKFSFFRRFTKEFSRFIQLLLSQGTYNVYKTAPLRAFMGMWSIAKLVLVFSYCSTLLSIMMVPASDKPIDTFQKLTDAVINGKYHVAATKGTSQYAYLKDAESGTLKDLADELQRHPQKLEPDSKKAMDRTLKGDTLATFSMRMYFHIVSSLKGAHLFYQSKDTIGYTPVSVAFRPGFPDTERFNRMIHRITEAGLYEHELDKLRYTLSLKAPQHSAEDKRALNLADIQMPLEMLMFSEGVATVVLLLELLHHRIKSKQQRRI